MEDLLNTPQFGIVLTIVVYYSALHFYKKTKFALLFPSFSASAVIIVFLMLTGISFETYNIGGTMISYVLGPVTVILAVPLYKQRKHLQANLLPILVGTTLGSLFSITALYYMSEFAGLDNPVLLSMLPKSVTAPIAQGISEQIAAIPALTVFITMFTGFTGPMLDKIVFKVFRIKNPIAQGIGLGTSCHGGGTAKALELGETQGAMSGLAMGLAGMITAILIPIFLQIIG